MNDSHSQLKFSIMAQNTPSHIPESRLSNLIRSNEYAMSLNQGMDTVASEL